MNRPLQQGLIFFGGGLVYDGVSFQVLGGCLQLAQLPAEHRVDQPGDAPGCPEVAGHRAKAGKVAAKVGYRGISGLVLFVELLGLEGRGKFIGGSGIGPIGI